VLDQRAGFVPIQARHHDIHENEVWLMIRDLGQRIKAVDRRKYLATFFGQQGLGGSANGFAVVDYKYLESTEGPGRITGHRISPR
jgi:hypothetical protein